MSIFDKLKKGMGETDVYSSHKAVNNSIIAETFSFKALPESLEEIQALPEATLDSPFKTAALTICALCAYGADQKTGIDMLNWLKGPRPLSNYEISFLDDRFRDGIHVPFSYFRGAVPENDYTPVHPFTLYIEAGPYADANPGYKKLHIRSGGADNPREVVLRETGKGQWFL